MANIIKELKKGNHTLTLKIKSLEDIIAFQDLEIIRLREENNSLKREIANNEIKELNVINYFCGKQAELLESILKIEEREGE